MKMKKFNLYILLFLLIALPAFAQSSTPYTRYGIGDLDYANSARRSSIGSLGTAVFDKNFISVLNPASWSEINNTRVEFNSSYYGLFLKTNDINTYYGTFDVKGFNFAFPISEKYGISSAFGLVPYSTVSYNSVVNYSSTNSTDDYSLQYKGEGGLTKLFIGGSYRLPFNLSIGASFDYYFGTLKYFASTNFINSSNLNATYEKKLSPKGLGTTIGLISPDFSSLFGNGVISNFRIGFSLNYIAALSTDTIYSAVSATGIDTVNYGSTDIKIPNRYSVGMALTLNKKFLVSLDYLFQPWSKFVYQNKTSGYLRDASKYSLGFEYDPAYEPGQTFWEQIIWRAGLSFEQTQYFIDGQGINQFTVGGGFSLPLTLENTIDVGINYSMRGTTEFNLIKENLLQINFGISLGDVWFIRYKPN